MRLMIVVVQCHSVRPANSGHDENSRSPFWARRNTSCAPENARHLRMYAPISPQATKTFPWALPGNANASPPRSFCGMNPPIGAFCRSSYATRQSGDWRSQENHPLCQAISSLSTQPDRVVRSSRQYLPRILGCPRNFFHFRAITSVMDNATSICRHPPCKIPPPSPF